MSDSVDARMVEAAARALAIENGEDPDDLEVAEGQEVACWTLYISAVESVLAALQPFRDAEQAETRERIAREIEEDGQHLVVAAWDDAGQRPPDWRFYSGHAFDALVKFIRGGGCGVMPSHQPRCGDTATNPVCLHTGWMDPGECVFCLHGDVEDAHCPACDGDRVGSGWHKPIEGWPGYGICLRCKRVNPLVGGLLTAGADRA